MYTYSRFAYGIGRIPQEQQIRQNFLVDRDGRSSDPYRLQIQILDELHDEGVFLASPRPSLVRAAEVATRRPAKSF